MAVDMSVLESDQKDLATPQVAVRGPAGPRDRRSGSSLRRSRSELAGLATLLLATACAYLWDLTSSGYANSFYAAAVQAGTRSWKAFFFGSIDSSNFITVDKPPAALWVMELSGRILGFSSFSMLAPQVLEGVVTVALVYAVVRRWHGHRAALVAGAVMATTPVAALMFRFNNPDALLVLLMTAAAYGVTRAIEQGRTRWLVLAGTALGFGFLAKMGQALIVVPGFGLAYLVAAPVSLRRRISGLLAGLASIVAAAGWWVLIVTVWPASSRPMIDGSSTNSIWNLIVGYNGLDRVVSTNATGGGSNFSGATGTLRLFNSLMGGQASWLIPAAILILVGGLVLRRHTPRTDRTRASLILWGGWLVVTGAVFSYGQGVIHTYYTVALVPAVAALAGIGFAGLTSHWDHLWARWSASALVAVTAGWAEVLLGRSHWNSWLQPVVAIAAGIAIAGFLLGALARSASLRRAIGAIALAGAITASLGGPAAYALQTIGTAHTGSIPSAGPAVTTSIATSSGRGPGGGGPGGSGPGGDGGPPRRATPTGTAGVASTARGTTLAGGGRAGSSTGFNGGEQGIQVSSSLVSALKAGDRKYRWVAATDGSQSAATIELATGGEPVMAIGGFNNQGGNISLAQFETYVAAQDIHYYIVSGSGGPGGGSTASSIATWVESHYTSTTIGGLTVYDLTAAKG